MNSIKLYRVPWSFAIYRVIVPSDNYRLPLPVGSFIVLTQPTLKTAHTSCRIATGSDKQQLSDKIRARCLTSTRSSARCRSPRKCRCSASSPARSFAREPLRSCAGTCARSARSRHSLASCTARGSETLRTDTHESFENSRLFHDAQVLKF